MANAQSQPSATTLAPFDITTVTASVQGSFDGPIGSACGFQWGLSTNYGIWTPVGALAATNGVILTANLTNLIAGQVYHVRAAICNAVGPAYGQDVSFNTPTFLNDPMYSFADANDGSIPSGALVQGMDGTLYGTASYGGTNDNGVVFKMAPGGGFSAFYSFTGGADGANPNGLVIGQDGNLYGTTSQGGSTNEDGVVFKITPDGVLTTLHVFNGADGADPAAALTLASDGNFYGTTSFGGTNDSGTIFQINLAGSFSSLYSFSGNADGANPNGALAQGRDGNLYGTTFSGGLAPQEAGFGTVFKITSTGVLTTLHIFGPAPDGQNPDAGLALGRDGAFYGTTCNGGSQMYDLYLASCGVIFRITTGGGYNVIYNFGSVTNSEGNPADGANPTAPLILGNDGYFYGTARQGGNLTVFSLPWGPNAAYEYFGTVFRISPDGVFATLYTFTGGGDGGQPSSALTQTSDGNFWGDAPLGGEYYDGVLFRMTAPAVMQPPVLTNAEARISWFSGAGASYQLQFKSDLAATKWNNLGGTIIANGPTTTVADSVTNSSLRFYRAVLEQ